MSADGEINVAVKAEGVDDAVEEMGDAGGGDGGGGGDGDESDGGEGKLSDALKGGLIGGILGTLLGPLLDALSPITKVLEAFLAPLAAMLLRLLAPVLRQMVKLLPAWFDFVDGLTIDDIVEWVKNLPAMIWDFVSRIPGEIGDFIVELPGEIWNFVKRLAGILWDKAIEAITWLGKSMKEIADIIAQAFVDALSPDGVGVEGENRRISPDLETGIVDPRKVPVLKQAFEAGQEAQSQGGTLGFGNFAVSVQTDQDDWISAEVRESNNPLG